MDIQLAEQRIFALTEKLTAEQARARAMDRRTGVFGGGLGSLLQRPKSEEVELLATQKRFEPFWHAACSLRQVYDRTRKFSVPVTGPEVQSLTLHDTEYPVVNRSFTVTAVEHCRDEERQQIFLDGLSGEKIDLAALIEGAKFEVTDLDVVYGARVGHHCAAGNPRVVCGAPGFAAHDEAAASRPRI